MIFSINDDLPDDYEEGKREVCNSHEMVTPCAAEGLNTDPISRAKILLSSPIFLAEKKELFKFGNPYSWHSQAYMFEYFLSQ